MIRLPSMEPRWHELPGGIRVFARPIDALTWSLVQAHVRSGVATYFEENAGGGVFDSKNETHRAALSEALQMRFLLAAAIEAWEGLADQDGLALPLTPENMRAFVERMPVAAELVYRRLMFPLEDVAQEKNASAPAPSGTSAAGGNTAGSAPISSSPAPAGTEGRTAGAAPTAGTSRLH